MVTAFFGEQDLKDSLLKRLRQDQEEDRFIQGTYYDGHRGCDLGCMTRRTDGCHQAARDMFGIPVPVAYWIEYVFEALPIYEAKVWATKSIEAMNPGSDLSLAPHILYSWMFGDKPPISKKQYRALKPEVLQEIQDIGQRHQEIADGADPGDWGGRYQIPPSRFIVCRNGKPSFFWSEAASLHLSALLSTMLGCERHPKEVFCAFCYSFSLAMETSGANECMARNIAKKSLQIFSQCPVIGEQDGTDSDPYSTAETRRESLAPQNT